MRYVTTKGAITCLDSFTIPPAISRRCSGDEDARQIGPAQFELRRFPRRREVVPPCEPCAAPAARWRSWRGGIRGAYRCLQPHFGQTSSVSSLDGRIGHGSTATLSAIAASRREPAVAGNARSSSLDGHAGAAEGRLSSASAWCCSGRRVACASSSADRPRPVAGLGREAPAPCSRSTALAYPGAPRRPPTSATSPFIKSRVTRSPDSDTIAGRGGRQ